MTLLAAVRSRILAPFALALSKRLTLPRLAWLYVPQPLVAIDRVRHLVGLIFDRAATGITFDGTGTTHVLKLSLLIPAEGQFESAIRMALRRRPNVYCALIE